MRLARTLAFLAVCLCTILAPASSPADTKVLTAEATYTMGEGKTMTFAEAMALQKAKQIAMPALFTAVRREIAKSPSETGAWSGEGGRRAPCSTLTD